MLSRVHVPVRLTLYPNTPMAFLPLAEAVLLRNVGRQSARMARAKLVLLENVQPTTRGSELKKVMPFPAAPRTVQLVKSIGGALSQRMLTKRFPPAVEPPYSIVQYSSTVLEVPYWRTSIPFH